MVARWNLTGAGSVLVAMLAACSPGQPSAAADEPATMASGATTPPVPYAERDWPEFPPPVDTSTAGNTALVAWARQQVAAHLSAEVPDDAAQRWSAQLQRVAGLGSTERFGAGISAWVANVPSAVQEDDPLSDACIARLSGMSHLPDPPPCDETSFQTLESSRETLREFRAFRAEQSSPDAQLWAATGIWPSASALIGLDRIEAVALALDVASGVAPLDAEVQGLLSLVRLGLSASDASVYEVRIAGTAVAEGSLRHLSRILVLRPFTPEQLQTMSTALQELQAQYAGTISQSYARGISGWLAAFPNVDTSPEALPGAVAAEIQRRFDALTSERASEQALGQACALWAQWWSDEALQSALVGVANTNTIAAEHACDAPLQFVHRLANATDITYLQWAPILTAAEQAVAGLERPTEETTPEETAQLWVLYSLIEQSREFLWSHQSLNALLSLQRILTDLRSAQSDAAPINAEQITRVLAAHGVDPMTALPWEFEEIDGLVVVRSPLWTDSSDNPAIQAALTRMPNTPAPVLNMPMEPPGLPPRFVGLAGVAPDSLPGSGSGVVEPE